MKKKPRKGLFLCNEGTGQVAGSRSGKVEQRTENPRVGGSIPPLATIYKKAPYKGAFLYMKSGPENHVRWTRAIPGARPAGMLRMSKSASCRFVRPWLPNAQM